MKRTLKTGWNVAVACAALSTTACVIDPYYSGSVYDDGTTVYPSNTIQTQTIYTGGVASNAISFTTGFLIGNAYYWNDRYYPVSYHNGHYRPDFNRPYPQHPDPRYRQLSPQQINHWRNHQPAKFDPQYRPNIRPKPPVQNNRPQIQQPNNRPPQQHNRPTGPQTRPTPNVNQKPPVQVNRPNAPNVNNRPPQQQNRPTTIQNRPAPNMNQRPPVQMNRPPMQPNNRPNMNPQRPAPQNSANPVRYRSASEQMNRR